MHKRSILLLGGALASSRASSSVRLRQPITGARVSRHGRGHRPRPGARHPQPFLSEGNGYTVSLALNTILAAGSIYNDKVKVVPELLEGLPKLLKNGAPDGYHDVQEDRETGATARPITGADFVATYRTIMNPNWDIVVP